MSNSAITLPITEAALRRLATEAKAQGITPEAAAERLCRKNFGMPLAQVLESVLEDARSEARHR